MIDDVNKIIKEQVYAFERLIRFCLFDYKQECKNFLNQLDSVTRHAHAANNDELRSLLILADVLNGELMQENLWERIYGQPYYIRRLLEKHKILSEHVMIFPRNRIKAYMIDNDIIEKAIQCIHNREELINRSIKVNNQLLCVASIPDMRHEFILGNMHLNGDFLIGLDGNYLVDCPYTFKSIKFLVKR